MPDLIEYDAFDAQILALLQADAQMSMQALGEAVGLSSNPVWRRIKRLEDEGAIVGRKVVLDPARFGLALTAFVSVRTGQHDAKWLARFAKAVTDIPEIVECHRMTGDVDYLLKVLVRDMAHYDAVYKALIHAVPGLVDVSSAFSMERLKENAAIAVPEKK